MRARKELRFKNLSVLKYLLHGETTVSPTPFALWIKKTNFIFDVLSMRHFAEDGCELQSESHM